MKQNESSLTNKIIEKFSPVIEILKGTKQLYEELIPIKEKELNEIKREINSKKEIFDYKFPPHTSITVKYHYAHSIDIFEKLMEVSCFMREKGLIEIMDIIPKDTIRTTDIPIFRFCKDIVRKLFDIDGNKNEPFELQIDTYSEISSLIYGDKEYNYDEKIGYFHIKNENLEPKSFNDFGYIENGKIPKIATLLLNKLAFVENLQKGIMKIHTSSYDKNGYIMFLTPEFIIDITQRLDRLFLNPIAIKTYDQETQTEFNFEMIETIGNNSLMEDINN